MNVERSQFPSSMDPTEKDRQFVFRKKEREECTCVKER